MGVPLDRYLVRATGRRRRRVFPSTVRRICTGYSELARVVLWLEVLGYSCRVHRLR